MILTAMRTVPGATLLRPFPKKQTPGERISAARRHPWRRLAVLALAAMLAAMLAGCGRLDFSAGPLLYDVQVTPDYITPNADGDQDVTEILYSLRRNADVSIYFENEAGERFYFRDSRRRTVGDYSVFWGGTVEDAAARQPITDTVQPAEEVSGQTTVSKVLPDGVYRWTIEAVEDDGAASQITGTITLENADTEVPELHNFAVVPKTFRPNQDGLRDDWVSISYYLTKDVEEVRVYLVDPAEPGVRIPIPEEPGVAERTDKGYHEYRYEAGVNLNAEPPPDGTYDIVAEARDAEGNAVRVTDTLTIEEGGKPRADIAQGEIDWEGDMGTAVGLMLGEKLCFSAVVTNEGTVPIRTTGPWPGQEYHFDENYNTLAQEHEQESWGQQTGTWRFGVNFDTTGVDFPFRWAVGRQQDLTRRVIDGEEQWYLMPDESGEVNGCIVIDEEPPVGTQYWWGGLIHERVNVPNNFVDRITVDVGVP